jgi:hypothetical protein
MPRCDTGYWSTPTIWSSSRAIAVCCVVDSDYFSPLLLRAQLVAHDAPAHPDRPHSHQPLAAFSKAESSLTSARPEQVNSSSSTSLASVSFALPLPAPACYIPVLALARYPWLAIPTVDHALRHLLDQTNQDIYKPSFTPIHPVSCLVLFLFLFLFFSPATASPRLSPLDAIIFNLSRPPDPAHSFTSFHSFLDSRCTSLPGIEMLLLHALHHDQFTMPGDKHED